MQLTALSLALTRAGLLTGFSPISLFSAGEPGVWYDPSDLTTMFQDATGTTPVTAVEQPVGLILDKSRGLVLGPELAYAASSTTGWTATNATAAVVSGELEVTANASASGAGFFQAIQIFTTEVGKSYQLRFTARRGSATSISVRARNAATFVVLASQTITSTTNTQSTLIFQATSVSTELQFVFIGSAAAGTNFYIAATSAKELPGAHASQTTATSRPVLSARYNLLTKTEQFDDAAWVKTALNAFGSGSVANTTATTDPLGGNTADYIQENNTNAVHFVTLASANEFTVASVTTAYTVSFYAKAAERTKCELVLFYNLSPFPSVSAKFDLAAVSATASTSGGAVSTGANIFSVGGGWYLCSISGYTNAAASNKHNIQFRLLDGAGNSSYTGDGTSGIYIWGASLVPANQSALPYQRVNTATDYDAGPAFPYYLKFDGIDDSLVTPTITPNTDKAQVFAGVRKLSDASFPLLLEMSTSVSSNNGSLYMLTSGALGGSAGWLFGSRGTVLSNTSANSGYASPVTSVLTGIGDISGDLATLRVNGTQAAQSTADQGTGNFAAYPLYIGSRGGSSLPFNGHLYPLIVRFGSTLTADQITQTETYVAGKTGVTL